MGVYIAFDVGTTCVKGCAFDESFNRVASFSREYSLLTPLEHYVEADPEIYWQAVADGARELIAQGVSPNDVRCVTFTTQGETMIAADKDGRPLGNAVVWLDDRARDEAEELRGLIDAETFYHTTGLPELSAATPLAKLMWFSRRGPSRVHKYLLLEDFLIYRMTGRFVTEQSLLSSSGYFDIINREYWAVALEACGVEASMLPDIVPCASVAGNVSAEAAAQTGLLEKTPVVAGAMDQVCAAIGAGNVREGVLTENTGTCLAVTATSDKPVFSGDFSVTVYTHFDGRFLLLAYNPTAAIVLKWFKDTLMNEYAKGLEKGANIYDEMTAEAAKVAAGADGVTLIPHFSGRLCPDAQIDMRGAFVGLGLGTTRGHMIRAILEGVAYMLRESVEALGAAGVAPDEIRCVGGASVSPLWNRIKASATNLSAQAMVESESTCLGAAMLGCLGVKDADDIRTVAEKYVRPARVYPPEQEMVTAYEKGFSRYRDIEKRLSGLGLQ